MQLWQSLTLACSRCKPCSSSEARDGLHDCLKISTSRPVRSNPAIGNSARLIYFGASQIQVWIHPEAVSTHGLLLVSVVEAGGFGDSQRTHVQVMHCQWLYHSTHQHREP